MFAGNVSLPPLDPGAVAGPLLIIRICEMMTDPDRKALVADLKNYADLLRDTQAAIAELKQREEQVLRREKEAAVAAEALAKREADAGEKDQQLQRREQRLNEMQAQIDAFKAELRTAYAA
jgi:hypothetical protein